MPGLTLWPDPTVASPCPDLLLLTLPSVDRRRDSSAPDEAVADRRSVSFKDGLREGKTRLECESVVMARDSTSSTDGEDEGSVDGGERVEGGETAGSA